MATTYEEVLALLGKLIQAQQETDRKFQETDRKFQETARLVGDLGGQRGLFMENQVAPAC